MAARWGDYDSCGFPETKRACGGSVVPEFSIGFSYQLSLLGFSIVNLYQCSQLKFNCSSLGFSTRLFCPFFSFRALYLVLYQSSVAAYWAYYTALHCTDVPLWLQLELYTEISAVLSIWVPQAYLIFVIFCAFLQTCKFTSVYNMQYISCSSAVPRNTVFDRPKKTLFLPKVFQKVRKSRQILILRQKSVC